MIMEIKITYEKLWDHFKEETLPAKIETYYGVIIHPPWEDNLRWFLIHKDDGGVVFIHDNELAKVETFPIEEETEEDV